MADTLPIVPSAPPEAAPDASQAPATAKPLFDPTQPFEAVAGAKPPFDPSKPYEAVPTSTGEALYEGALAGASANWRDEIYGASKASGLPDWMGGFRAPVGAAMLAYEHATGKPGEASAEYDRATKEIRDRIATLRKEHPYAFGTGEIGGAVASLALTRGGARAAGIGGRIAQSSVQGATYGALSGAGEGEGLQGKAVGAAEGAGTGAALGAVGATAAEVLTPLATRVANVVRGIRNPDDEAARRVAQAVQADFDRGGPALTPEDIAAANAAGTPRAVVDAGAENTRALARSAANTSPDARAALTEMTQERFEAQSPRIAGFIRQITGGANAGNDLEAIEQAARQANRPAYARAYAAGEGGLWNEELERLAGSPSVRRAMENAVERGRDRAVAEGYGAFNPGVTFENGIMRFGRGRGAPPYPNMQYWDYVQRELRDMSTAATRAGRNEEAGALTGLRRQLLTQLDTANPEFAAARQGAAQAFGAENALEAGQRFVSSTSDIGEARRAVARMSPAERELFARGYASNLAATIERQSDNRNVLNATFLNNPAAQERARLALGPDRARQLEALLRAERVLDRARTNLGNSTTARQLFEIGAAGGATAGAEGLLNQDINPQHLLTAAIIGGFARRGAQVVDQRVARRVGEMLAADNPAVLARGVAVAARNPRILNALRRATSDAGTAATSVAVPAEQNLSQHGGATPSTATPEAQRTDTGERDNPVKMESPADLHHGAERTEIPSPAQAEAGNYQKRHIAWKGLDLTIETEAGQDRTGMGGDGKPWSVTMDHPYGYIKRTAGADGEQVDVTIGPHPHSQHVFVFDQIDPASGKFDEHKVVIGTRDVNEARSIYDAGFSDGGGQQRRGAVREMSVGELKQWLDKGDLEKPVAYEETAARARTAATPFSIRQSLKDMMADPRSAKEIREEMTRAGLLEDQSSMTHQAETPNPARPYIDAGRQFLHGGISEVLTNRGVALPEWSNRLAGALNSDAANTALGTMMGGNILSKAERFVWPVQTTYGKTIDMPVSVNPSKSMILRELAQAPHGDVRALRAPNGDIFMWPANEAMHIDIAETFDLPFGTRQALQQSSYLINKRDVEAVGRFANFDDLVARMKNVGAEP